MTPNQMLGDTAELRQALAGHQAALRCCCERKDVLAYLVKTASTEGEAMASLLHLVHLDGWNVGQALEFLAQLRRGRIPAS